MSELSQQPQAENVTPKLLLTEEEAAESIGLTPRFLQTRRYRGDGPPFVRISIRCVRYIPADLEAWAMARRRTSTSDGPETADTEPPFGPRRR
jgi:hypothetical protein